MPTRLVLLLSTAALALTAGCSTTIEDTGGTTSGAAPDATTSSTQVTVPEGPASELLLQLVREMTGLSALIGPDVGPAATDGVERPDAELHLVEIEALWSAARGEVEAANELIARQIDTLVAQARVAVERNRPADADKAALFLRDVVAAYVSEPA